MNAMQLCKQVADQHQFLYFREKKDTPNQYDVSYDNDIYDDVSEDMEGLAIREDLTPKKGKGWTALDAVTANAVMTVYNALHDANKEAFANANIFKVIDMTWKCIK